MYGPPGCHFSYGEMFQTSVAFEGGKVLCSIVNGITLEEYMQ